MQLHAGLPTVQHLLKTVKLWCVKYAEQKQIQNHPLKIGVRKIREQVRYFKVNRYVPGETEEIYKRGKIRIQSEILDVMG